MSKVLLYLRYMRISRCSLHKCQETLVLQIFSFLKLKYNYILFAFHLLPPISGKYRPHKLSQIQIFFFLYYCCYCHCFLSRLLGVLCASCICLGVFPQFEKVFFCGLLHIQTMPLTWNSSHLSMLMFQKFGLSKLSHISGIFNLFFIFFDLISLPLNHGILSFI